MDNPRAGRQLALVCLTDFGVWLGAGMVFPYLPVFLRDEADASLRLIGVIAAAYFVAIFVFSSPFGRLSDRVGRKPLMVGGTVLYAVATLLFLTTTDPWLFVLFRFIEGTGVAAVVPAAQAFVAEITTNENRSRAYGWLTSAQFGGMIFGPPLAVPVYQLAGGEGLRAFYAIFVVGAAVTALAAAALIVWLREPEREATGPAGVAGTARPPYRALLTRPVVAIILVVATAECAMGAFEVNWSIWLTDLSFSMVQIGVTFTAFSVPMLLSFVGGRFADRHSRFALMTAGFGVQGVAWILFPAARSFAVIMVLMVVSGLAFAFAFPAKQAFLVQVSPRRWLGTIQGMEQSAMQMAAAIGTLTAPLLYGLIGGWVFAVSGVVALTGLAVAAPTLRREWACVTRGDGVMSCSEAERLLAGGSG